MSKKLDEKSVQTPAQNQAIRAAKNGDVATLCALIGADSALFEARDADGSTPLHCASWKGHIEVVSLLLDLGTDVNAQNQNDHWVILRYTPPHMETSVRWPRRLLDAEPI